MTTSRFEPRYPLVEKWITSEKCDHDNPWDDLRQAVHDEVKEALASAKLSPGGSSIRDSKERARDFNGGGLTFDELVVALRNLGYDLMCGRCASVFYTGVALEPHDDTCRTRP
jgi:hypothetical protein